MHRKFTCSLIVYSRRTFKKIECVILITSTMVSVIAYFISFQLTSKISFRSINIWSFREMAGKTPRRKPKKMPYPYGGPGRGPPNKFSNKFYLSSRYLNCEHCRQKVYSSKVNSGKATLMLRHWAHSIFCKEIRSARGIVVDRILLEYDLEWRDVPNLDISDENYEVQRGIWYWGRKWWATTSENSHQLMFVFYLQTVKTRPERDGLYPAVTTEGLLFSQTARETLGEYVETNEP